MQSRFAPQQHRLKQLKAAEKLLTIVSPEKQYPLDFVYFRITGIHLRDSAQQPLINGDELAEDLRIFITKLSSKLAPPVELQKEKIYTVEQLAEEYNVCTKTVHRWRKYGLLARKFVFPDGKKRLGFRLSDVEKFLEGNKDLVEKAKSFTRLTKEQKQQIIRRASAFASRTSLSRHQVITRVAKQLGRAPETVRYTILNYEKTHPDKPIFRRPWGVIDSARASELYKLYQQGCPVTELMRRFDRSKSSIYRIINQRRARDLLARKIQFVPSDEFFKSTAREEILGRPIEHIPKADTPIPKMPDQSLLPSYLQRLKEAPVLDRETEKQLFRRYNYLKYLASAARAGINPAKVKSSQLKEIEGYLAEADKTKELIIEANLRLVVSVALKHTTTGTNLADLISEGNISLMRAVESFDYTRGFRFASHATWAITKDYARKLPDRTTLASAAPATLAGLYRDLRTKDAADILAVERAHNDLRYVISHELTEREQYVILNHFGLLGSPIKKNKKTLKQIGDELGLTKERVRQIELVALQKLRQSLSPEQFELLIG